MLILRRLTKLFARRDVFPDSLRKIYGITKEELKKYDKVLIDVQQSNDFKDQYKKTFGTKKDTIDKFWKELQDPDTWFNDGNNKYADTHYLEDYSSKGGSYVVFSKKINNADRFNYRIYKPKIIEDKITKEKLYYQKIVLDSCSEHRISGKSGSYAPGQSGNTWHSSSKAAKRKRKLLKQDKKDDLK